jgi:hypothetical protein
MCTLKKFQIGAVDTEALSNATCLSGSIAAASDERATQWDVPVVLGFPRRAPPLAAPEGKVVTGNKFIASSSRIRRVPLQATAVSAVTLRLLLCHAAEGEEGKQFFRTCGASRRFKSQVHLENFRRMKDSSEKQL